LSSAIGKTVLPNGLRVISERITSIRSIAIGVWVDVGSRNELPSESGLSHLIEHMHFKGTRNRSAARIANDIEELGGALNAFTTREHTCYYARVLDEHLPQAVDVLTDILLNSTYSANSIKREKQVVLEEIKESEDTPSDRIHDLFAGQFWGKHPLAHSILGDKKTIAGLQRSTLLNYIGRHYNTRNIVVTASGNLKHDTLVKLIRKSFRLRSGERSVALPAAPPRRPSHRIYEKDIAQTHMTLGFPSLNFNDPRKFALLGLNFYLGGGMSSTLFQEVRERRGLAYSIYSFQDFYRDTGAFGVCLSADAKNIPLALDLIRKQLRRVCVRPVSAERIDKIKAQIKGSLTFSMESASGRMNRLARLELMTGHNTTLRESFRAVERITAADLLEVAREVFDEQRLVAVALGPVTQAQLADLPQAA